ncbi:MAG: MerR family transcriptional regulator [Deltaproteobacteria bacterium]|jgi:DNA-binding transcriptional MerR regulator|nr:MerR family transcriptional regulator [Deltaproteobacteria bacterium]
MKKLLSIKEFSELTGIGQQALRHWDSFGLFVPAYRNPDTGYRYYTPDQIIMVKFITVLSSLNIPLKTLAAMREGRSPESTRTLIEQQARLLDIEMRRLREQYAVMFTRLQLIRLGDKAPDGETSVRVTRMEEMPFILGPRNEWKEDEKFFDPFIHFCRQANELRINLNYPIAARHESMDAFVSAPGKPEYFLSLDPAGNRACPAGDYLCGFTRGHYGELGDLPERMTTFMRENNLAVSGPVYTAYLHDELCLEDPTRYLAHVCVAVV